MTSGAVRQSKRWIRGQARGNSPQAACDGKRVYATWSAAERIIRRMRRKGKSSGNVRFMVYRCRYCQKFHVGQVD